MTGSTPTAVEQTAIAQALAELRNGRLVAIPTETVYGLAADADNPEAVAQIYRLKGRPSSRPLIVHLASRQQLDDWACDIPEYARLWARAFWPGPLAMVLPKQARVSPAVTGGQNTVALRVPNHPLTLALLAQFGGGLAAPSANRYGRISPTRAEHVLSEFTPDAPFVLDGGACGVGIESTIVSCLDDQPSVLRPGAITAEALADIGGVPVRLGANPSGVVVPGQVSSHYAPETPTQLLPHRDRTAWPVASGRVGFLGFHSPPFPVECECLLPLEPSEAAQQLYAQLRHLDASELDCILVEAPPEGADWIAVWDRLQRAVA